MPKLYQPKLTLHSTITLLNLAHDASVTESDQSLAERYSVERVNKDAEVLSMPISFVRFDRE